MKAHFKIVLIILAIICGTFLAVLLARFLIYLSIDQPAPGSEVEQIRITAVERDLPKSIALNPYIDFSDAQTVQIHYGCWSFHRAAYTVKYAAICQRTF